MPNQIEATNQATEINQPKKKLTELEKQRVEFKKQQADAMKMMVTILKGIDPTDSSKGMKPGEMLMMASTMMEADNNLRKAESDQKLIEVIEASMANQDQALVGKHIRTVSDSVFVGKQGAFLAYEIPEDDIAETQIQILDEQGQLIRTLQGQTEKGTHRLFWDGRLADKEDGTPGELVPHGAYNMIVSGKNSEEKTILFTTFAYPLVQEMEREGKNTSLILEYPDKSLEKRPYDSRKDKLSIAAPFFTAAA